MFNSFEWIISELLHRTEQNYDDIKHTDDFTESEIAGICRKFMDKVAITMIINEFEDEKIVNAVLKLARVERIIVAFNIIEEVELSRLAFLLNTNLSSLYAQKSTALKRLKAELENID